jgi:hypothetical protein
MASAKCVLRVPGASGKPMCGSMCWIIVRPKALAIAAMRRRSVGPPPQFASKLQMSIAPLVIRSLRP